TAGGELGQIAVYAEALSDATWDAASAHRLLRRRQSARSRHAPPMAPAALDLLGKVGAAVALDLESEIVISDPLLSDTDLVDAVRTELGEGVSAHVLVAGDSPRARSARRLHWAQGRSVLGEVSGDVSPLVVTRLPGPDGATDTAGILTAADDVQLEITKEQRAVLIGPATAL